jgi:hypothetical protein
MELLERLRHTLEKTPILPDEDEYDPFAGEPLTPPEPGEEGDDTVHAEENRGGD